MRRPRESVYSLHSAASLVSRVRSELRRAAGSRSRRTRPRPRASHARHCFERRVIDESRGQTKMTSPLTSSQTRRATFDEEDPEQHYPVHMPYPLGRARPHRNDAIRRDAARISPSHVIRHDPSARALPPNRRALSVGFPSGRSSVRHDRYDGQGVCLSSSPSSSFAAAAAAGFTA